MSDSPDGADAGIVTLVAEVLGTSELVVRVTRSVGAERSLPRVEAVVSAAVSATKTIDVTPPATNMRPRRSHRRTEKPYRA